MPLSLWTCRLSSGLPFPPVSFKSAFSPAPPTAVSSGLFTLLHFPIWHVRHCIGFVCDFSCLLPSRWLRTGRHSLTARRIPARQRSYRSPPNTALSLCEFEFGGSLGGGRCLLHTHLFRKHTVEVEAPLSVRCLTSYSDWPLKWALLFIHILHLCTWRSQLFLPDVATQIQKHSLSCLA